MIDPRLPSVDSLRPWLKKLAGQVGSCVVVTIEHVEHQNYPHIGVAWLSREERKLVRKALQGVNAKREKWQQPLLDERP